MPDDHSPPAAVVRQESGRFGPGNPGRPPGARGRRGSHVVDAILDDFIANKDSALKNARYVNGPAYLNTILKLLPAQPSIGAPDVRGWSDAEVDEAMKAVRKIFAIGGTARDQLIQIEALMFDQ
jgi:hypothetical protein